MVAKKNSQRRLPEVEKDWGLEKVFGFDQSTLYAYIEISHRTPLACAIHVAKETKSDGEKGQNTGDKEEENNVTLRW